MPRPALAATRAIGDPRLPRRAPGRRVHALRPRRRELDINVASAHAVLAVLTDEGYLVRNPRLRTYTLGPSVVALGSAALERHPAVDHARDEARRPDDGARARGGRHRARRRRHRVPRPRGRALGRGARGARRPAHPARATARRGVHGLGRPGGDERLARPWAGRQSLDAVLAGVRARGYSVALEHDARRGLGDALDHLADAPIEPGARETIDALRGLTRPSRIPVDRPRPAPHLRRVDDRRAGVRLQRRSRCSPSPCSASRKAWPPSRWRSSASASATPDWSSRSRARARSPPDAALHSPRCHLRSPQWR